MLNLLIPCTTIITMMLCKFESKTMLWTKHSHQSQCNAVNKCIQTNVNKPISLCRARDENNKYVDLYLSRPELLHRNIMARKAVAMAAFRHTFKTCFTFVTLSRSYFTIIFNKLCLKKCSGVCQTKKYTIEYK